MASSPGGSLSVGEADVAQEVSLQGVRLGAHGAAVGLQAAWLHRPLVEARGVVDRTQAGSEPGRPAISRGHCRQATGPTLINGLSRGHQGSLKGLPIAMIANLKAVTEILAKVTPTYL